jgi:hypothetical protein
VANVVGQRDTLSDCVLRARINYYNEIAFRCPWQHKSLEHRKRRGPSAARRPGSTLSGFLQALAKLPKLLMPALRILARGVRERLDAEFVGALRINGFLPIACDGSRLELLTNVLDSEQLSHATAAQIYRWRWKNEGLFRDYKRMLKKMKLQSRTVKQMHREAEGSLLAMQVLLAGSGHGREAWPRHGLIMGSPRRMLLRLRSGMAALVRSLGPRQFAQYQRVLEEVRSEAFRGTPRPNECQSPSDMAPKKTA